MTTRPAVPKNVERALWAESSGYCLNPACNKKLIINDSISIADMAHIVPHSAGGKTSVRNMILLCKNCHKEHEPVDHPETKKNLFAWKEKRQQEVAEKFARRFENFDDLSAQVVPLLEHNYRIFSGYGPETDAPEAFKMWKKFEHRLIVNNAKLKLLFSHNMHLFANNGRDNSTKAIRYFIRHVDEFAETRSGFDGVRKYLFPWRVLSIFGIEREPDYVEKQNINGIQSLIGALKANGYCVKLHLPKNCCPYIGITKNGHFERVFLNDVPKIEQRIFLENGVCSETTELTLANFIRVLRGIENNGSNWNFEDLSDLTVITVNRNIKVKLFWVYELSVSDLESTDLKGALYAVNLYRWNSGSSTEEAIAHAKYLGIELLNFGGFMKLCRRDSI